MMGRGGERISACAHSRHCGENTSSNSVPCSGGSAFLIFYVLVLPPQNGKPKRQETKKVNFRCS